MISKENREVVEGIDEDIQELVNSTKRKFMDIEMDLKKKTNSEIVKRKLEVVSVFDINDVAKNWNNYIYAYAEQIKHVYYAKEKRLVIAITDGDIMVFGEGLQLLFSVGYLIEILTCSYISKCESIGIKEYETESLSEEAVKYIIGMFGELE